MRESELRKIAKCAICGKPFGHTGLPLFYRLKIERFGVDLGAVQRQDGLAMAMGSSVLANVMGPDEDMTKPMMDPIIVTICEECSMKKISIGTLAFPE